MISGLRYSARDVIGNTTFLVWSLRRLVYVAINCLTLSARFALMMGTSTVSE